MNSIPLSSLPENLDDGNIIVLKPKHLIHGKSLKPIPNEIYKGVESTKRDKPSEQKWKELKYIM